MSHAWKHGYVWAGSRRTCVRCGAVQIYDEVSYDRVTGGTWRWRPLVGRCPKDKPMKFRVYFNTHKYVDWSDEARPASVVVKAETADEAREIVRARARHGKRYIGSIHQAELLENAQ